MYAYNYIRLGRTSSKSYVIYPEWEEEKEEKGEKEGEEET